MIVNNNVQSVLKAYTDLKSVKNTQKDKQISASELSKKDEVLLSSQAQSFSQILQKAKNMPQVRQEKVDGIAAQFAAGQYNVDTRAIADKMLNSRY